MNKRYILIIGLILCLVCSLQAISAAEVDTNGTQQDFIQTADVDDVDLDDNLTSIANQENDEVLGNPDGTLADLDLILNGGAESTYDLRDNYTYNEGTDSGLKNGITISRSITINGIGNVVIDGGSQARIFNILSGASVTINGITFINGQADNGGAILSAGELTLNNCKFEDNTATDDGGAIMIKGAFLRVDGSTFNRNAATNKRGGAIYLEDSHYSYIKDCSFEENTAGTNGGAIDWHNGADHGNIVNSNFTSNVAKRSGGAVYWYGTNGTINGSRFDDNHALGQVLAIDSYGNETYGGYGGAIMWTGSIGDIYDSIFNYNEAHYNDATNSGGRGGAIYLQGSVEGNCSDTTFDKCIFIGNIAGTNGGAIDWHEGAHDGLINNSVFKDNKANANGGAVYWRGHHGDILNSNFTGNIALGVRLGSYNNSGDGGAVYWAGINGTVGNCRFIDNEAIKNDTLNKTGRGGAVYVGRCEHGNDNCTFRDCYFFNNTAGTNGGAIDWNEGADGLVDNCTFIDNTANRSAGAIFWRGHNGTIQYSKFYGNKALGIEQAMAVIGEVNYGGDGGAVLWSGSEGDVEHCNFVNNTAAKRGGAVFLQGSGSEICENTTFRHSYFANNIAGSNGGAIDWNNEAVHGLVDDVTFFNNTAGRSGGAIFWGGYNGTVKNSKFINNRATGAFLEYKNMTFTYNDVIIINDDKLPATSTLQHDKLYVLNYSIGNGQLKFESWVLDENDQPLKIDETVVRQDDDISPMDWGIDQYFGGDGGTILWGGDVGLVYNCSFVGSNSRRRGGAAYMTGSDNVTFNYCNFTNCTSGTNGGGLDWLAGANDGRIYNCIFDHTRAARSAGAIYYDGDYGRMENITIIGTKAWGGSLEWSDDHLVRYIDWDSSHWDTNTTGGDGGAIMITGDHGYLYNVNITDCIATGRGGAVFLQANNNVTFELCTFINNRAEGIANNTWDDDLHPSGTPNRFLTGNGGAIGFDFGATLGVIKNSRFINNTAARLGGAISFAKGSSNATIENSEFTNNVANRSGGAISWDGEDGNMMYCNFTNNRALGNDIDRNLFDLTSLSKIKAVNSVSEVLSSDFLYVVVENNGTHNISYTMYVYKNGDLLKLEYTTETGPSPTDWATDEYFGGDGGTIFWRGDRGTVDNCRFIDSNSARRGGGAYMTGSDHITFQNSYFENCTSGTNGGGLDWLAGANYGKILNCIFNNTRAARSAGAIYYDGDYGEMKDLLIINTRSYGGTLKSAIPGLTYAGWDASHWDTNTTGGDAGAIMFTGDNEYIYNVTFIKTTAQGRGGAVFLQDNKNITFEVCNFTDCVALGIATNTWKDYTKERNDNNKDTKLNYTYTGHGGAIAFDVNARDTIIKDSEFTHNYARRDGGAINLAKGSYNATIENCIFNDNSAGDDGGVINWEGNLGTVKNIACYNSTGKSFDDPVTDASTSNGGVICLTGNNVTISDSNFTLSTVWIGANPNKKPEGGAFFITGNYTRVINSKFDSCWCPDNAGAIYIIGNHTTIIGSSFENCNASEDGGAINVEGLDCKLYNSTFTNNFAGDDGGAINWIGSNGYIDNITCINNRGIGLDKSNSVGGSVSLAGDGITLTNSNFTDSYAVVAGGAVYIRGVNDVVANSSFTGCSVSLTNAYSTTDYSNGGGAIFISGDNANVTDCNFTDSEGRIGGTIYIKGNDATVDGAIINDSYAPVSGGAIYIEGVHAYVKNSEIENAVAKGASGFIKDVNLGGAIYIKGNYASISDSSISNSSAVTGGAIFLEGSHTSVIDSNFTDNLAHFDGGAIYWKGLGNSEYLDVDGCNFIRNVAIASGTEDLTRGGGAIFFAQQGKYGSVRNSNFTNNSVQSTGKADGGAILWDMSSHGVIDNCIFDGNYVTSTMERDITGDKLYVQGGALFLRAADNYTISNSVFKNCWSDMEGGAMYLSIRAKSGATNPNGVYFINLTFINNTAKSNGPLLTPTSGNNHQGGGAIFVKETKNTVSFDNITFINNTAYGHGGAISVYNLNGGSGEIILNKITFDGNNATEDGGSLWFSKCAPKLTNSRIIGSIAGNNGGGIYSTETIKYSNLTFINNTAKYGGALYWARNAANTIQGMNFINNTAFQGGAIYLPNAGGNTRFTVTSNNFTGNGADYGGAVYVNVNNVVISNNNFTQNSAIFGGAIYEPKYDYAITVQNSAFNENNADYGGAIFSSVSSTTSRTNKVIEGSTFTNNTANIEGGAVYVNGSYQIIRNSIFDGNNATENGGAVYVNGNLLLTTIERSTFNDNNAGGSGGAIYKADSGTPTLEIKYDTFTNNTAHYNGGAVLYIAGGHKYRDYNKFDGIAVIDSQNRTDVSTVGASPSKFITQSVFDWDTNNDYLLLATPDSDIETPTITVILSSPADANYPTAVMVINATNLNMTETIEYTEFHYNPETHKIYMVLRDGIRINNNYTLSIGFEDANYMYKEFKVNVTAHGTNIGDFELLQRTIENAISVQKADNPDAPAYIINLTREGGYTFTVDDYNHIYDTQCVNLTNIDKPILIYGNGWRIDALGHCRIFNITASNVTIFDTVFVNGNANGNCTDGVNKGGAIFWAGAYGSIINVVIDNCTAERGGGIYYNASAINCTIVGSTFTRNNATTFGGAIDCNASSMGLYNTTFENNFADTGAALCREINATNGHGFNNTFRQNYALTNGSALAWINAKNIRIDTYHFYDNHAGNSGGAIYVGQGSEECKIINSDFDNNYVDDETDGHGGAIEWYSVSGMLANSTFTRNHAFHGGAVYVGTISERINITNSTFRENYAIGEGGAVSIEASSIIVDNSKFYDNYAVNGGALYVGGEGNTNYVYSSIFEGNKANNGIGGAIDWVASSGTIHDSKFTSNYANYGGGLYFGGYAAESRVNKCTFTDNHARYKGGAIDCNSSAMYLTNSTFDANVAQFGAALCREVNAKGGHGENNTFKNNHAHISGAALGWMGSENITIINYKFINNSADVSGGAIYAGPDSHNSSIIDCYFENNYVTNKTKGSNSFTWMWNETTPMEFSAEIYDPAYGDPSLINQTVMYESETIFWYEDGDAKYHDNLGIGGAINMLASDATIENTEFKDNTAISGGAIHVSADGGNTILNNSKFIHNTAYENGGAVILEASAVHIDDSEFRDNIAVNGSALYIGGVGTDNKIHTSTFVGNNATEYGGAVFWKASAGEINGSKFINNLATFGGAIFLNGISQNTNITNTTFKSNTAIKRGGAIDCNAQNIGIHNLTFDSNIAGEYGAALCRESGATGGHGKYNNFTNNHAGIAGAALAWMNVSNIEITHYRFINNTAGGSGGAIYISEGSDNCKIIKCEFEGNHLTNMTENHTGGAVDCQGSNITINMSSFKNNGAYDGGALYVGDNSGDARILDSVFEENYATGNGGAIGFEASSVSINRTNFTGNTANINGGAIYVAGNGTGNKIWYVKFKDNKAGDHGGAIDWLASAGEVFYSNFTGNEAVYGGGIYLNGVSSNSKLFNNIFDSNRASKNGGAIDCNASNMGLNNTRFTNNYAGEYGAALCREANATRGFGENNTFIGNKADIAGAALAWLGVTGIKINNYTFINNTAYKSGGAIYVREDSPNCTVLNSKFDKNYVTDIQEGQGGAIDWLGDNGYIYNSTFKNSFAVNGGTLFVGPNSNNMTIDDSLFKSSRALGEGGSIDLYGSNAKITNSNFTYSTASKRGGAISAHGAYNTTIADCIFNHTVGAGYVDESGTSYGDGGALFWENANNLNVSNVQFLDVESHAMGAVTAINCNDSIISNAVFDGMLAVSNGGSVAWINSDNVTIESSKFLNTAASYNGGSIFLNNTNAEIRDSKFNNTSVPWGNGGAIYVAGNVTIDNSTFDDFKSAGANAGAIYFHEGTSTLCNSSFDGYNAIWIGKDAAVSVIKNNITGDNSNNDLIYLENDYNEVTNPVLYAIWNDGNLTLDDNNFAYVTFNNGTIFSQTYSYMMGQDNITYNITWMDPFTFWVEILDDTHNNHIICVNSSWASNDVTQAGGKTFPMTYNRVSVPETYVQGSFHLQPHDDSLKLNTPYNGTVNVKMPLKLELNYTFVGDNKVVITAKITPKAQSNFTLANQLVFSFNGQKYYANLTDNGQQVGKFYQWTIAIANLDLNNLSSGHYTVTAYYPTDDTHWDVENSTDFDVQKRQTWISIVVDDYVWGNSTIAVINTTGNGTVVVSMNGRNERFVLHKEDGNYTNDNNVNYTMKDGIMYIPFDQNYDPGVYFMSVLYIGDEYYEYAMNETNFTVFKQNTTIIANGTNITFIQDEIINVTVDELATGYIEITMDVPLVNGTFVTQKFVAEIVNGTAQFRIPNLFSHEYRNVRVVYDGDIHFNGNATYINFTVGPTDDFNVTVDVNDIPYGENATVRVNVPSWADGNVTIYVDGIERGTVKLENGVAVLNNVSGLAGGEHFVNVTYNGGQYYAAKNSTTVGFNVTPTNDWKMNLTKTERPYGENTTINIELPDNVDGKNVTVMIGNNSYVVNITDGLATLTLNNLSAGSYMASVTYAGDANYSEKTQKLSVQIVKAKPTVNLTAVGNDVIATVSGNATGNVTFHINGREYTIDLINGNATLPNNLTIGNNFVVAVYNGDGNYTDAYAMKNFVVDEITTDLTVEATPSVVVGKNTTITVTMVNVTSGKVTIEVNGYNYTVDINSSGVATLVVALPVGNYTATAYYLGDAQHVPCTNVSAEFEVYNKTVTELNITVEDFTVEIDNNITFTVDTNSNVTDLVVKVNGVEVTVGADGKYHYNATAAGNYTITAEIAGNDYYFAAQNASDVIVVYKHESGIVSVVADPITTVVGNNTTITVTMAGDEFGSVIIEVNGYNYTVAINGSKAVLTVALPAGVYNATVYYPENEKYNATVARTASEFNVTAKQNATVIINANSTVLVDGILTFNVTNSTPVVVTINGVVYNATNGVYTFNATKAGEYEIIARSAETEYYYAGFDSKVFNVIKHNSTISVNASSTYVGGQVEINVTGPSDVDGIAIISINNTNYTVNIVGGKGSIKVSGLGNGTYNVTATYLQNAKYLPSTNDTEFTVSKLNATVEITGGNSTYLESANITVTVGAGVQGNITITLNDTAQTTITQTIVDGKVVFNLPKLAAGNYTVSAVYNGNDAYNINDTESATFEVKKADPKLSAISSGTVYDNGTISIYMNGEISGVVTVIFDSVEYPNVVVNNGLGEFKTPVVSEYKDYSYTVKYAGNENFTSDEWSSVYRPGKINTYGLTINVTDIIVGEDEIISVIVPNHVDDVVIWVNGTKYRNTSFTDNVAKFNVTGLKEGLYTVTANVNDTEFDCINFTTIFTVSKTYPTINITVVNETSLHVGDKVTVIVSVPEDVTENVTIMIDGREFSTKPVNGNATFEIEGLAAGNKTVTAFYYGDDKYRVNATTADFTISKSDAFVNITVGDKYEIESVFNITISNATAVNVTINGEVYEINATTGNVIIDTSKLAAGNYTVTATIYESGKYVGNSTSKTFEIYKHASEITSVVADPISVLVGKNTTITVTMANNETGKVSIEINGHNYTVEINDEHKAVLVVALPEGTYEATAYYLGDDKYNVTDKTSAKFNVTAKENATIVINNIKVIEVDGKLIFNVTNSTPVVVTINDVEIPLVGGNYTFDANEVGEYTIIARSAETDTHYAGFNSSTFKVIRHAAFVNITGVSNTTYEIESLFNISAVTNSTSAIVIEVNGKSYTVANNTPIELDSTKLAAGHYIVNAYVAQNDKYEAANATLEFTIEKHTAVIKNITVPTVRVGVGENATITVTMDNVTEGTLLIEVGGHNYTVPISGKVAELKVVLPIGKYNATAYYLGDDLYSEAVPVVSGEFTVADKEIPTIEIVDAPGAVEVDNNITFTVNNSTPVDVYVNGEKVELKDGKYTYNVTTAGNATIVVKSNETGDIFARNVTQIVEVYKHASDLSVNATPAEVVVGKNTTITVTMANNETGKVMIEVGGYNYTVDINDEHKAILVVALPVGSYNATVYYMGDAKYNETSGRTVSEFEVVDKNVTYINITDVQDIEIENALIFNVITNSNATLVVKVNGVEAEYLGGTQYRFNGTVAGNYMIIAEVEANDYYTGAFNNSAFDVFKHTAVVDIVGVSNDTYKIGSKFNISAVTNSTNAIVIEVNGKSYTVANNTPIELDSTKLAAGHYIVNVNVAENDKYGAANATLEFTIVKHTAVIDSIVIPDADVLMGENATITVNMGNVTSGTVQIEVGGHNYTVEIVNKVATLTVELPTGEYSVKAYYLGDENYTEASMVNPNTFKVLGKEQAIVNITIIGSDVIRVDEYITFNVTTNSNATPLIVKVNGEDAEVIGNGQYRYNATAAGNYTITAEIAGNEYYLAGHNSTMFSVIKHDAPVDIEVSPEYNVDDTIVINITSSGDYVVNVTINGTPYTVDNGKVTIAGGLPAGQYTVVATVYENGKYLGNYSQKDFTVNKYAAAIASIDVSPETVIGNNVTVTVTMGNVENGTVMIEIDGKNYTVEFTNKVAVLDVALPVGNYTAKAYFVENYKYNATVSDAKDFKVVDKLTPEVIITAPSEVKVGDTVNITVKTNGYNLTVTINGVEQTVSDGNISYVVTKAGSYTVVATVTENETVYGASNFTVFTAVKSNATLIINPIDAEIENELTITVTNVTDGNIIIKVNNETLTDGKFTPMSPGVYTVTVESAETDKYYAAFNMTTFTVGAKVTPEINITAPDVAKVGETVEIEVKTNGNNLTVWINGEKQTVTDGKISYTVTSAGIKSIYAQVTENATVYGANKTAVFEAVKNNATLIIGQIDVVKVGDEVTITVNNITDGSLTIKLNGKEISNGTIFVPTESGNYTITVESLETGMYYAGFNTTTFTVEKRSSFVNVTADPINVSDVATITINAPADINGTVKVSVNGTNYTVDISAGKGSLELKDLKAGTYAIKVTYVENAKYLESTNETTLVVSKVASSVTVNVANITVGDVAVINITLTDGTTGNVTIKIGDEYEQTVGVTDGEISIAVPGLTVGDKTVNVTYNGDGKFLASEGSAVFTVGKATPDINLAVHNITYGETETITVFINATGSVTINLGNGMSETVDIVDGKVKWPVAMLDAGDYSVEVTYNGNDNLTSTSATANFTVAKANLVITVEADDIVYGDVAHITVKSDIEVKVNVTVNSKTTEVILNGTVDAAGLNASKYTVEVKFAGNLNYNPVSVNATFNVIKANTTVDVEIVESIKYGETQMLNITVSNINATGNVTVNIDGVNHTAPLEDGKANFTTSLLAAGNHTVTVVYDGDVNFNGNWTVKTFEVIKLDAPFTVVANTSGSQATLKLEGLPSDATGYVIINVNGTEYGVNLTQTREVTVSLPTAGTYDAVATYLGDDKYVGSSASTSFEVDRATPEMEVEVGDAVAGGDMEVKVILPSDAKGNITVQVGDQNKTVEAHGGENTIVISNVTEGTQNVTTTYSGDNQYGAKTVVETVTVKSSVYAEDKLTRAVNSPYDYEAVFLDKKGNVLKDTEVQFVVNGKTYTAKTDDKGVAKLTTSKLGVGNYDVTSINPVTGQKVTKQLSIVKRLVENKDITMDFVDGTYYVVRAIGDNGKPVGAGEFVAVTINTVTYAVETDSNGYAKLKINLNPGSYTVTAEYKNTKVSNKVKVKQTLKLVKTSIKVKRGKNLVLKATLKWSSGKAIKGKKITFKFNGKKYKAKTNSKGLAKVTIKGKITKKVKKGKYTYLATYITNTVKGKVTVK